MAPSAVEVSAPGKPERTMPLTSTNTITAPISARAIVPRPPARLTPPSTAAVSAFTSQPTPVSEPVLAKRAA